VSFPKTFEVHNRGRKVIHVLCHRWVMRHFCCRCAINATRSTPICSKRPYEFSYVRKTACHLEADVFEASSCKSAALRSGLGIGTRCD
jgi:hypothetical protein